MSWHGVCIVFYDSAATVQRYSKGKAMLYEYDDGQSSFECYLIAEHLHDDTRSFVQLLPEYVEQGERSEYWVNNQYLSEGE